jgi:quinol monooxygenase YgiN
MQIVVANEKRSALQSTLGSLLGPTRVMPGCVGAHLYCDLDKRTSLLLIEEWETREQFDFNMDKDKLNTLVAAIELSSEAPLIRIDRVERTEGVETLALHRRIIGGGIQ